MQLLARTLEQARLSWGAVSGREARKLLPTVFVLLQVLAVLRNAAGVAQLRAPLQSQLGGAAALDQVVAAVQASAGAGGTIGAVWHASWSLRWALPVGRCADTHRGAHPDAPPADV